MDPMYNFIMTKTIEKFELTEEYNRDNAIKLLLSSLLDSDAKKALKKYISNTEYNKLKVEYINENYGRLKTNINNKTGITQMNMWNIMKRNILKDIYIDIDIVNCHPIIFYQLCKYYKLEVSNIKYLVKPKLIMKLKKDNNISDKEFKKIKCCILYGGNINKYGNQIKIIQDEIKKNTNIILKMYQDILKQGIDKKSLKVNSYYNIEGCALSYLIQQIEKQIVLLMINYFKDHNINVGAYISDGLHIDCKMDKKHLLNCKNHVNSITPFNIDLVIKPFIEDDLNNVRIVENDYEASQEVLNILPEKHLVYSNYRTFYNYNNVYITNDKIIKKLLLKYIMNLDIYKIVGEDKNGEVKYITLTKNITPCEKILKATLWNMDIDDTFYNKLWTSNLYKLCFDNGYYDFKKKTFNDYDINTITPIKINRDYIKGEEKYIKIIYDKILNPIFNNNDKLIKYFLNIMARAMAGHTTDKNWIVGLGFRNCGKGVLVNLFENCFEEYIMTTNSNNFIVKNNNGDEAKNLSWSIKTEFRRICFTNEIKIDKNGESKIDGNMIKKLSSGGDKIQARLNHQDEIEFKPQATFILMCNDLPIVEPTDALKTCIELHFPSQFVDEPKKNEFIQEYKADDSIKDLIKDKNIINAFITILFNHYEMEKPKMIDIIKNIKDSNDEDDDTKLFRDLFIITDNEDDYILVKELNNKINNTSICMSKKNIKRLLLTLGCIEKKFKNQRAYRKIKFKDDNTEDNNINILDD